MNSNCNNKLNVKNINNNKLKIENNKLRLNVIDKYKYLISK